MSKRNLNYSTVTYNGIEILLSYTVDGKYIPATMHNPEEFPEVEIQEVSIKDIDIKPILLDSQMDEIYELLNNLE